MTGLSALTLLVVLVAGIGAGFLGYAVGASSLVSYPAMLALGIPPVVANATNTVGVIGTGIGGVLGAVFLVGLFRTIRRNRPRVSAEELKEIDLA